MRRLYNKLFKKEKVEKQDLDKKILKSKEYQALECMNYIMNFYDQIEKSGYDPLDGDEVYIQARFAANAFTLQLLEQLGFTEGSKGETSPTPL